MAILTLPGVYAPRSDSALLADAVRRSLSGGEEVLDVFTGSGFVAVEAALAGAGRVHAVDISRRAALTARINARLNGVHVDARCGDLLRPFAGRRFDLISANPPYLPSEPGGRPPRGRARAWEGGAGGRELIDRLIAAAPAALAPGGRLLVVHSGVCDFERSLEVMRAAGLEAELARRVSEPLGPLLAARREQVVRQGLLDADQREDHLAVIEGRLAVPATVAASAGSSASPAGV